MHSSYTGRNLAAMHELPSNFKNLIVSGSENYPGCFIGGKTWKNTEWEEVICLALYTRYFNQNDTHLRWHQWSLGLFWHRPRPGRLSPMIIHSFAIKIISIEDKEREENHEWCRQKIQSGSGHESSIYTGGKNGLVVAEICQPGSGVHMTADPLG